jgi:serine protease
MLKYVKIALAVSSTFILTNSMANEVQTDIAPFYQAASDLAIKNKYIVVFNTPLVLNINDSQSIQSFAISESARVQSAYNVNVEHNFGNVLNGALITASSKQVQQMLSDPSIKYIEQDQIVKVNPLVSTQADQGNAIWGLDRTDQRDLPLNSNYHYDFDGSGVTAYVIDTGVVNTHNEFGGRSVSGYDFVDNDSNSTDCNGHGTHVAGTIGGQSYGIAKNVNIVGVRVLGCNGSGTNSGVINGINWVKNNATGPSVANMSLGGGASQATDDAVNSAVNAGVTFVVAAGNDNANACNYSPARAASAITVGSTASNDARSSFSNYGSCLDIYAPGSSIKSAWYTSNSATRTISGTSMASPHVAGVVALYLNENPSLSPSQLDSLLSQRSSKSKVSDAKSGSPNELLYSLDGDNSGCEPNCPVDATELTSGQTVNLSGAQASDTHFFIDVPTGQSILNIVSSGGTGDADIYVKRGSKPTSSSYDCRPYKNGNDENCNFNTPESGKWYVMVSGYSAFSNLNLTATFSGSTGDCSGTNCLANGSPKTNLSGNAGSNSFYEITVPANKTLTITTSGGSGDVDLFVKKGSKPTNSSYDCRPYRWGNNETCSLSSGQGDVYHIMLNAYTNYSGVTLTANY